MADKKSIRFFNDHKVRAVWSEEQNKWFFSATDVVRAINDEQDYVKAGNYWRWLKKKLAADGIQLVSDTHDFKFEAPDGKMRKEQSEVVSATTQLKLMAADGKRYLSDAIDRSNQRPRTLHERH